MATVLTRQQARRFYDWLGRKFDSQAIYEQSGFDILCAHGRFAEARSVFEFGCGTGRLAEDLFRHYLGPQAHYRAVDISPRMADIARKRLQPWHDRARVEVSDGSTLLPLPDNSCERFVSCYVIDLLSEADARQLLTEAHRILSPHGLLCLASITTGITRLSRFVMRLWQWLGRLHPLCVGGCRPVALATLLAPGQWQPEYHQVLTRRGVAIEILVARTCHTDNAPDGAGAEIEPRKPGVGPPNQSKQIRHSTNPG